MATFDERLEKTKEIILDPHVSASEATRYMCNFLRFEYAIRRRDYAMARAEKLYKKMNRDLQVFALRNEMANL